MKAKITVDVNTEEKSIIISSENAKTAIYDGETVNDICFALECYCEDYCKQ